MTVPQRLSIVTLGVADVARSTRFYESLGWRRAPGSQESITFFEMEGSALGLFGHGELAEDAGVPDDGPGTGQGTFRGVTVSLDVDSRDEVDATFAEWVDKGATAVKPPGPVFWGGYTSYVADPDGHLWEIVHNPLMPNGSDGRVTFPDG
ncbi:MAG: VOC family protein [Ilumatobacteraceae bacterium]